MKKFLVTITNKKTHHTTRRWCRVDDEDYLAIKKYKWHLGTEGYVYTPKYSKEAHCTKKIPLHIVLLGKNNKGLWIDHINNNRTDYRRSNLRWVTPRQNCANATKQKNAASKYKGVRYDINRKRRKRWMAACEYNGKSYNLGRYYTEIEAALVYNKKAQELWGEFAKLNEVQNG